MSSQFLHLTVDGQLSILRLNKRAEGEMRRAQRMGSSGESCHAIVRRVRGGTCALAVLLCAFLVSACGGAGPVTTTPNNGPLPSNPAEWVCPDSLAAATAAQIAAWCAAHPDRGTPLPSSLTSPPPLSDLSAKNEYDVRLAAFIKSEAYKTELGWLGDATWRFTGPYVGEIGKGSSYGTHLPVRVYYSPEVIDWLCNGRVGELPDGAMTVKEMHLINDALGVTVGTDGCMTITADVSPEVWVPMLKHGSESLDQWYWTAFQREAFPLFPEEFVDPPLLDKSGVTLAFVQGDAPPTAPNPAWYPTGYYSENRAKLPDVIVPQLQYGAFCLSCHASAANEYTFASLNNVLGQSIRYKLFTAAADAGTPPVDDQRGPHIPPISAHLPSPTPNRAGSGIVAATPSPGYMTPFSVALANPSAEFLTFYDQLADVSFSKTWEDRLPAQTYDHVGSSSNGPAGFLTSDQCAMCHDAVKYLDSVSNMLVSQQIDGTTRRVDLSPYNEWQVSPMGLSGRDPIFYAQLQGETNTLPEQATCIENTCLHCHGVMGQRQLAADTPGEQDPSCASFFGVQPPAGVPVGRPFRLDMVSQWPSSEPNTQQRYGALARDGISCTVCHRISQLDLGQEETFTGNFVTGPAKEIYGPYENVLTTPMHNALGLTPQHGQQIASADLCASCHDILLPVFTNQGVQEGYSYEQSTHLEWLNSDYAPGRPLDESCQGCHMPTQFEGQPLSFKIANFESTDYPPTTNRVADNEIQLTVRNPFARHTLHGLNIFLNEMFQQFPLLLGFRQGERFAATALDYPALIAGERSMLDMASTETASVDVSALEWTPSGALRAVVNIANKTGHDLPSGVGFRRMFLEVLVESSTGELLWASGRTNELGALLDGTTDVVLPSEQPVRFPAAPFQPHYQLITRQDQAQIYQELTQDSEGALTTSFLHRVTRVKDNRIRPKGYNPEFFRSFSSPFIQVLAETPGDTKFDPHYTDPSLTGSDDIEYLMAIDPAAASRVDHVRVRLYSQSIPPFYLQQRFRDAGRGPRHDSEINRLYYMASHLNAGATVDTAPLNDWKLLIATKTAAVSPRPTP